MSPEDFSEGDDVRYIGTNRRHKGREMEVIGVSNPTSKVDYVVCSYDTSAGPKADLFHPKELEIC